MPNHVENRLTFDCSRERLQEILTAVSRDQDKEVDGKFGVGTFDFEKVIPMPEDIYRGNLGSAERELYGKKKLVRLVGLELGYQVEQLQQPL